MKGHHFWLILAAYGVWFAIFSGTEEVISGKYWKVLLSIVLALIIYVALKSKTTK